jgi:hypothetical protein
VRGGCAVVVGFGVDPEWVSHDVIRLMSEEAFGDIRMLHRLHVLEGMATEIDRWDEVSAVASAATNRAEAIEALCKAPFRFSDVQATTWLTSPTLSGQPKAATGSIKNVLRRSPTAPDGRFAI